MIRVIALLTALSLLPGCGSSQSSPIVEYNAAMESYDRESKALQEIRNAAGTSSDQKARDAFLQKAKQKEQEIEKIKVHAKNAASRL